MKYKIKQVAQHPLISGSAVIFVGTLLANIFNFLFNLFMSRNVSVGEFGTLTSLISLISLATMPAGSLIPTVVNFAAMSFAKNEEEKIYSLFLRVGKLCIAVGILILCFFIIFASHIGIFFQISNSSLIIIAGLCVFLSYLGTINTGLLQAKLSFGFISFANFVGAVLKFLLAMVFVLAGLAISGGMWAFFISYLIPYLLTFIPLRSLFQRKVQESNIATSELLAYGAPAAITTFCLMSFITSDVILVKHFFNSQLAGMYAGISLVGKVIFFFSAPIGTVMFPLIVQKHTRQESYKGTFHLALLMVFLPSIALTGFYYLFPNFVIEFFLKKAEYQQVATLIGFFALFICLYACLYLLTNFYLSIKKINVWIPIFLGSLAQIILISMFHKDFFQVIAISTGITALLLLLLLLYLELYE